MKLAEKKFKESVYDEMFKPMYGKEVVITWDKYTFISKLVKVHIPAQKDILHLPDKILGEDGKYHTPAILQIVFESGKIDVILDKITDGIITANGVTLITGSLKLEITCES